jgi:hypothetical protein
VCRSPRVVSLRTAASLAASIAALALAAARRSLLACTLLQVLEVLAVSERSRVQNCCSLWAIYFLLAALRDHWYLQSLHSLACLVVLLLGASA